MQGRESASSQFIECQDGGPSAADKLARERERERERKRKRKSEREMER